MTSHSTLEEFAKYWDEFKDEIEARADVIFEQLWQEVHEEEQ